MLWRARGPWVALTLMLLLTPVRAVAIGCGEVVEASLSAPGEIDEHALSASAGQRVAFFLASDFGASVELLDPLGAAVAATAHPSFAGGWSAGPLAASGSYSLRVSEAGGATGEYQLAWVGPGCSPGERLRCGETVPATVASGGLGLHSFRALAGDVVRVSFGEVPGTLSSDSALVAPDGSFVLSTQTPLEQSGFHTVVATARVSATPSAPAPDPEPPPLRELFLSPSGSNANSGLSAASPWLTFAHAVPQLQPGDRLTLLDGTYLPGNTGLLDVDCDDGAQNGSLGAPITVRAANERAAVIVSDGSEAPVQVEHCSHWSLIGIAARNVDLPGAGSGGVFKIRFDDHIVLRRLLASWPNRYENAHPIGVGESRDVLVEECEAYAYHRHGISVYKSENVTVRRSYVNSRGQLDVPGGYESDRPGGDESFVLYASSNSVIESSIAEFETRGFEIHGGQTFFDTPGGYHNRVLGSIHYSGPTGDHFGAAIDTRMGEGTDFVVRPAYDNLFRDFLILDATNEGFQLDSPVEARLENVTVVNALGDAVDLDERSAVSQNGQQPVCGYALVIPFFAGMDKSIFGGTSFKCSMTLVNSLIVNGGQSGLSVSVPSANWLVEYTNSVGNAADQFEDDDEDPADALGHVRFSGSVAPTGMGPGGNGSWAFVPPGSNMSGAGKDGADIGANVLLRYQDGLRTNQPLWDPASGAFPCGAIVAGINDAAAGPSCATVHTRLGVTPAALAPALAAVDPIYTLTLETVSAGIDGGGNAPPAPICGKVPDGAKAIACGQTLGGTLLLPGDSDSFTFLAQAGEQVNVTIEDGGAFFAPVVRLFDPAGARVDFGGGQMMCGPSASCSSVPLPAAGTYALRVMRGAASSGSGEYALTMSRSPSCVTACNNGIDDDLDGEIDHPTDTGCRYAEDISEAPECADGIDNDGDGLVDYADGESGCMTAASADEDPECDNGVDDDGDGLSDADGAGGAPDPTCKGIASGTLEKVSGGVGMACGLGPELLVVLPLLAALRRRARR